MMLAASARHPSTGCSVFGPSLPSSSEFLLTHPKQAAFQDPLLLTGLEQHARVWCFHLNFSALLMSRAYDFLHADVQLQHLGGLLRI